MHAQGHAREERRQDHHEEGALGTREIVANQQPLTTNVQNMTEPEALLREAANATGDRAAELRDRAMKSLRATRETLHETQDIVLEQGRRAARLTDDYVHDNPWQAVAAAGLAGLLLGLVLAGRR